MYTYVSKCKIIKFLKMKLSLKLSTKEEISHYINVTYEAFALIIIY
jgi:hypothetical protein